MAPDPVKLRFWEKLTLAAAVLLTVGTVILGILTYPIIHHEGKTFKTYVNILLARTLFRSTTVRQHQSMIPFASALSTYETFANGKGIVPTIVDLPGGAKGFWIGDSSSKDVIVHFVGGGYVIALTRGHLEFCWQAKQTLHRQGHDVAIFVIQYTLAPQSVYPQQLIQAVDSVRYILAGVGRKPSNIILAGDSAGAPLALDIIAHAKHPHPLIAPLNIKEPFRGLLLISPWSLFQTSDSSWKNNVHKDMCAPATLKSWSEVYLGGRISDNYAEPGRAGVDWWKGIRVRKVLVTAGRDDVMLDTAKSLADDIKASHPDTVSIVRRGECHIAPIAAYDFGDTEKGEQAAAIDSWLASCF